ncbi:MAG: hypothetical protein MK105_01465 [Crocinitomicaceae bacterium]|nr:hypothetical protein [Crocinitomicaceae bacterium]
MNRFINMLLLFLLVPTMLMAIYVGFDLPVSFLKTTGAHIPYREEIFLVLGLLILIVNVRRSIRRWMGMRIVSKQMKFKWNEPVSKTRKRRIITYTILEVLVMTFVGVALYIVTPLAWFPAIAFIFGAADNIVFTTVGLSGNHYRIGLSSKALIIADREVILLYFKGLRKISIQQQSIYFDYIKGLQLTFPSDCIQDEHRSEFFKLLEEQIDQERVFFSKNLV